MDIPEFIEVDVSSLELGDVLRVENLQLDKKIVVKSSEDQIIASVTHPMAEEVVETIDPEEDEEGFMDEGETSTDGDVKKEDGGSSKDAGDSKAEE